MKSENFSLIGVIGESNKENETFCKLAYHFDNQGINVPKVLDFAPDYSRYLQEDLGEVSLFSLLEKRDENNRPSEEATELLHQTMQHLCDLQFKGGENLDFSICYPQSDFNKRTIFWDVNYFKYNFLKFHEIEFDENRLETDFENFAELLNATNFDNTFLMRDCQSRNVMIHENKPYFIDFQGGRCGPIYYDVASFLWQARANFPDELRAELLDTYINQAKKYRKINKTNFLKNLNLFILLRNLQVLGAYGFRGIFQKKAHFLMSIPPAIENLRQILSKIENDEISYLLEVLRKLTNHERYLQKEEKKSSGLTVRINSFSFRNGVPEDFSGNGGGYVFDCRAIHNPGRYEKYKKFNGMQEPVIDFLDAEAEMQSFLENVYQIANQHVTKYLERGFTDLMFSFGCTGGQHRSVYSAEKLTDYLLKNFNISIILNHREQNVKKEFFAK